MPIWQNSNLCWDEEFRVFLQKVKIISTTVEVSLPVSISSQERTKQVHRCLSLRGKQPCWTAQAGCQPAGKTKQNWGLCGLCLQIQSSNCSPIICPCESSIPESWATTTQRQTSWSPAHYTQVVQGLEHDAGEAEGPGLAQLDGEKAQGAGQCPIAAHSYLGGGHREDGARPISKICTGSARVNRQVSTEQILITC